MKTYAGIDLHSSTNYTAVIDEHDRRVYGKRLPNRVDTIVSVLEPFKKTLEGVVVESTYNWYWLVDGLQDNGYTVHLANPSYLTNGVGPRQLADIAWNSLEMTP
jgi:transposase